MGDVDEVVDFVEVFVEWVWYCLLWEQMGFDVLQQDGVELCDCFGCLVIVLYQVFVGVVGIGGFEVEGFGELGLDVEDQLVFVVVGQDVQVDVNVFEGVFFLV